MISLQRYNFLMKIRHLPAILISQELSYECLQCLQPLMIDVERFGLSEEVASLIGVAKSVVTKGKHVEAVDAILRVKFIASFPDEQVGQRDSKIVHGLMLE